MGRKGDKPKRKRVTAKAVQATEEHPVTYPDVEAKPEIDDDEPVGADGLTGRRREFVDAITGAAFMNAPKAAEMAGYAADNRNALRVTACRLLTFVNVQQAIAHKLAARRIDNEYIRNGIADLTGSNMAAFLSVGPDGNPMMDWTKAAASGAIGHVKEYVEEGFEHGNQVTIIKRKFKIYDRLKAFELMAKLQGMLGGEPQEPEREIKRRRLLIGGSDTDNADHN